MKTALKDPIYFPIERGLYEVAVGLKGLGTDLGQGHWDHKIFQIDSQFLRARENKLSCLRENRDKYILRHDLPYDTEAEAANALMQRFIQDAPECFEIHMAKGLIHCLHTGDQILFAENFALIDFQSSQSFPKPTRLLDALLLQVSEDLAITRRTPLKTDFLAYLNICSPSHWAPGNKIGKNFAEVHAPIPGNEKLIKVSPNLVETMISKGPFVRFVWSFVTDQHLNHHPDHGPGRSFDPSLENPFSLRVERQVTWGLPQQNASLFAIHVSFIPGVKIQQDEKWRAQMRSALLSMTPAARKYKGVAECFDELLAFLN